MAERAANFLGSHAFGVLVFLYAVVLVAALLQWRIATAETNALWKWGAQSWRRIQDSPLVRFLRVRWPKTTAFFAARLSPEGYLGLHFSVAAGVCLLLGALFFSIADAVGAQEWLVHFDRALAQSMHEHSTGPAVQLFRGITELGDARTLAMIGAGVVLGLALQRRWRLIAIWVIAGLGVGCINQFLKNLFRRIRPELINPWVSEPGWSFPSGHAMGSLLVYGMLSYTCVLGFKSRAAQLILSVALLWLVLAIGFSRLYLGAHYFSDIVAGYAAAGAWLAVCISGNEVARRHFSRS